MNAVIKTSSQYTAEYANIAATLPGQSLPWLQTFRSAALSKFSRTGFPSARAEEWRHTNVSALEKKLFAPVTKASSVTVDPDSIQPHRLADCWLIVMIDGHFNAALSDLTGLPETVSVMALSAALTQQPEPVQAHLGLAVSGEDNSFIDFNSAWFTDGLWFVVPDQVILDKPVQLLHIVTQPDSLAATRNLIIAGTMAELSLIESYIGIGDIAYLSAAVTEIFVGENAKVNAYKLQTEATKAYHFGGTYVAQDRHGRFNHHCFSFGALLARNEVHTNLGYASECDLNGLYLGTKRQHVDNHTRINHRLPHAISHELYKGILDQRARGVFQGRVVVSEDAQHTDSVMNNNNLLLSENAEADTKPQLEIYADDVKCAHGVTVGQLDEKSIFYLQSRCVDEPAARAMLTFAFANEMVDKIAIASFKAQVLTQLLSYFPQSEIDQEWL